MDALEIGKALPIPVCESKTCVTAALKYELGHPLKQEIKALPYNLKRNWDLD